MQSYTLYSKLQNFFEKKLLWGKKPDKPNRADRASKEDDSRVYNNERLRPPAQSLIIYMCYVDYAF